MLSLAPLPESIAFLTQEWPSLLRGEFGVSWLDSLLAQWLRVLGFLESKLRALVGLTPTDLGVLSLTVDPASNIGLALVTALQEKQFLLNYQPQIDLRTGEILGVEALMRWQHPQKGLISPAEFIPVAEERGLIVPMGYWALEASCRQYQAWLAAGMRPFKLAVNLSMRQLQEADLVERIAEILTTTGMDTRYLTLEVTESCMVQNQDRVIAHLSSLQKLGIHIAIDDFGVGYASLSVLKNFPVHTLKIDRSFLENLIPSSRNHVILGSIIELGHHLKLNLIAEGIENLHQLQVLRGMNCHYGQGYFFSRPLASTSVCQYFQRPLYT
jgi:EAL domain-containing protein (putative c-di-GMP-specific phosphodiesterase class I)